MRRTLLTAALVATLLLAGCSGLGGGPTETPTPTPAATPTDAPASTATPADTPTPEPTDTATPTPEPTATEADSQYPAGFGADGVTDPGVAVSTHQELLTGGDYTATAVNTQRVASNGSLILYSNTTVRSSLDTRRLVQHTAFNSSGQAGSTTTYLVNDTIYFNNQSNPTNQAFATRHAEMTPGLSTVQNILSQGNWTAAGETTRRGETVLRYDLVSYTGITNASGTVYVTSDGFIQTLTISGTNPNASPTTDATYRYDAATGNVTVDLPGWVQQQESS